MSPLHSFWENDSGLLIHSSNSMASANFKVVRTRATKDKWD